MTESEKARKRESEKAVSQRGGSPLEGTTSSLSRFLAFSLLLAGCAHPAPKVTPAPASAKHLTWFQNSAEYPALTLQVYRQATAVVLERAASLPAGSWAVILDIDETVLDNSEHERRTLAAGVRFSDSSWAPWVREKAAPPVPGAVAFIHAVQAAGGHVALVSNRADSLCADTRINLDAVGVRTPMVLCKTTTSDKNERFRMVAEGTAPGATNRHTIVAWVGDNIQDFPGMKQSDRDRPGALDSFGSVWFVLPNPMYGSWEN